MKIWMLLLLCSGVAEASMMVHHTTQHGSGYEHLLSLYDSESNQVIKSKSLGYAQSADSWLIRNPNKPQFAMYLPGQSAQTATVVLLDEALNEKGRLTVAPVTGQKDFSTNTLPMFFSADGSRLGLLTGGDGVFLNLYDLASGTTVLSRQLGRKPTISLSAGARFVYAIDDAQRHRRMVVVDTNSAQVTSLYNPGKHPYRLFEAGDRLLFSIQKDTRKRPVFELKALNMQSGDESEVEIPVSESHFVFAGDRETGVTYIAGKRNQKKRDLFLARFKDNAVSSIGFTKRKIMPRSAELSGDGQVLMVIGEDKMATISTADLSLISRNRLPFDVLHGVINETGTLGIIQENSGSEIGFVDLVEGDVLKQVGAGRMAVKIGKNAWRHVVFGWVPAIVTHLLHLRYSTKNIQFSKDEKQLLVVNANSNDITVFDLKPIKKHRPMSTGSNTQLMLQGQQNADHVLTVGRKQLCVFDRLKVEKNGCWKGAVMVGFDVETNDVYFIQSGVLYRLNLSNPDAQPTPISSIQSASVIRVN